MTPGRRVLFLKAHIPEHQRRTASGATVTVREHDTATPTAAPHEDHGQGFRTHAVKLQKQKRDGSNYAHVHPPASMPEGAVAFMARRPDRPERFGLYHPNGAPAGTPGHAHQDAHEVRQGIHDGGRFHVDDHGHVFPAGAK